MMRNFCLGENAMMDTQDDGLCSHAAAIITMIYYVSESANAGQAEIRILSDDPDI